MTRQQPHLHRHKAYRAQNTTIDSHQVAMEVHEQHRIQYAAVDSGATGHFYPDDYIGEQHDPSRSNPCRLCQQGDHAITCRGYHPFQQTSSRRQEVSQVQRDLATTVIRATVMQK